MTSIERRKYLEQFIKRDYTQVGVYKITNIKSNKVYIGSSNNIYKRCLSHIAMLINNEHQLHIQNSFNKHGLSNFKFEIIELCNIEIQFKREQYYLDTILFAQEYIETVGKDNRFLKLGFNLSPLAEINYIVEHSEEYKENMSKILKDVWQKPGYREKMEAIFNGEEYKSMNKKIRSSPEFKKKISDSHIGRWTTEYREKMSKIIKLTRTPEYNQMMSDIMNAPEMNQHLSNKTKELWEDDEYRKKLEMTEEKKQKISKSISKRWEDEEYRNKVTERQNCPDVNKRRSSSRKKTMTDENYTNNWFRQVTATSVNGSKMIFRNMRDADDWIIENKPKVLKRGVIWQLKWLFTNNVYDFLGYKWEIEGDDKRHALDDGSVHVINKQNEIIYKFESLWEAKVNLIELFPIEGVKFFPVELFHLNDKYFQKHKFKIVYEK